MRSAPREEADLPESPVACDRTHAHRRRIHWASWRLSSASELLVNSGERDIPHAKEGLAVESAVLALVYFDVLKSMVQGKGR